MSAAVIVPMAEAHLSALAELEAQCFSSPWSEEALREELGNPCAHFLTALCDGEVAGYLGCHHIGDASACTHYKDAVCNVKNLMEIVADEKLREAFPF